MYAAIDIKDKPPVELVDILRDSGDWPNPVLFQAIRDQLEESVAPLVALVDNFADDDLYDTPVYFATHLLSESSSIAACHTVTGLFRRYNDDRLEDMYLISRRLGEFAIQPLLEIGADVTLTWFQRAMALEAVTGIALRHSECVPEVASAIRNMLSTQIEQADVENIESITNTTTLVSVLATLKDELSRPLFEIALERGLVDLTVIDKAEIDACIVDTVEPAQFQPPDWYHDYYKRYVVARTPRNISRNDSCWCGSGKKYKKCHLDSDAAVRRKPNGQSSPAE